MIKSSRAYIEDTPQLAARIFNRFEESDSETRGVGINQRGRLYFTEYRSDYAPRERIAQIVQRITATALESLLKEPSRSQSMQLEALQQHYKSFMTVMHAKTQNRAISLISFFRNCFSLCGVEPMQEKEERIQILEKETVSLIHQAYMKSATFGTLIKDLKAWIPMRVEITESVYIQRLFQSAFKEVLSEQELPMSIAIFETKME